MNSLFCEINFLEFPKYSWNLQMLSIFQKFKNWKIILKNSWKIDTPFGRRSWKIDTPFGTLERQVESNSPIMNLIFYTLRLENLVASCRDKLYRRNKIKLIFLIILFDKIFFSESLPWVSWVEPGLLRKLSS